MPRMYVRDQLAHTLYDPEDPLYDPNPWGIGLYNWVKISGAWVRGISYYKYSSVWNKDTQFVSRVPGTPIISHTNTCFIFGGVQQTDPYANYTVTAKFSFAFGDPFYMQVEWSENASVLRTDTQFVTTFTDTYSTTLNNPPIIEYDSIAMNITLRVRYGVDGVTYGSWASAGSVSLTYQACTRV